MAEMILHVVKKEKNYTCIDNGIFKDTNLSAKAKGVLTTMLSLPPTWKYSIEGLATLFSDGETSIRGALQELEANGYLKRTKIRGDMNKIVGWQYTLYEVKQSVEDKEPDVGLPQVDFPHVGLPHVENLSQLNTNKSSTKESSNNTISKDIVGEKPSPINSQNDSSNNSLSEYEQHMYEDDVRKTRKIVQEKTPKKSRWQKCSEMIDEYTQDETLRQALRDYLSDRLAMKDKPIYPNQWKGLLNRLTELSANNDPIKIVKQSIERAYGGFFPVNEGRYYRNNSKPDKSTFGEYDEMSCAKVGKTQKEEIKKNGQLY